MMFNCAHMVVVVVVLAVTAASAEEPSAKALALGQSLYATHCASCHGENLEGQPDWQRPLDTGRLPAPPHDASGHSWHHAYGQLFTITKQGIASFVPGYESDMPVFSEILTDDEIHAILNYIKSTWPEREREFHDEVTRNSAPPSD